MEKIKPRSQTPGDEGAWAWQARDAAAKAGQLGINAYAIYCALSHFESAASTEHKRRFAVSYEQIAAHVGCAKNTVARTLPALQRAGLIRIFSGSNGSHRATRNAFFLASISYPPQGHGRPSQGHDVNACEGHDTPPQGHDVKPLQGRFNKNKELMSIKNNYTAPPQAAAGVVERKNKGHACPPLGGGSGPKKTTWQAIEDAGI